MVGMLQTRDPDRTRETILLSALREIHRKGYKAASVSDILASTGLTKGALYHHFPNKQALGLAALDLVRDMVAEMWLRPLDGCGDPVSRLQETLQSVGGEMTEEDLVLGCPLNNLAQEMSALDEEFRRSVLEAYDLWRDCFAAAFERGQEVGTVDPAVDPKATAAFIVAALTGCRGLAKTARSAEVLELCAGALTRYLETLRA